MTGCRKRSSSFPSSENGSGDQVDEDEEDDEGLRFAREFLQHHENGKLAGMILDDPVCIFRFMVFSIAENVHDRAISSLELFQSARVHDSPWMTFRCKISKVVDVKKFLSIATH